MQIFISVFVCINKLAIIFTKVLLLVHVGMNQSDLSPLAFSLYAKID